MPHKQIDFAIIGQPKSGTTALAQFLDEHPQVCMSHPKESNFFATDIVTESDEFHKKPKYFKIRTAKQYDELFKHARNNQILGEASTSYLYSSEAANNIYQHNSEAKIIVMLRNPIDFMHSLHMQYVNETVENENDFKKALKLEQYRQKGLVDPPPRTRCPSFHYYLHRAQYSEQLKRYFDIFPKKQILVLITEEFQSDNVEAYENVLEFLGVSRNFRPDFTVVHGSKAPRVKLLNKLAHTIWIKNIARFILGVRFYTSLQKQINKLLLKKQSRKEVELSLRQQLQKELKPEVEKTSVIVDKDLVSLWRFDDH